MHRRLIVGAALLAVAGPRRGDSARPDHGSMVATDDLSVAMARMHEGMNIVPSGDADWDFAAMMIPHHQGAIDMAQLYLPRARDQLLVRLAQEIIVTQKQEIAVMRDRLVVIDPTLCGSR